MTPKRPRSSPEAGGLGKRQTMEEESKNSCDLSASPQLLEALSTLLDAKLGVLASKEDFKSIMSELEGVREENMKLKNEITLLKEANAEKDERITALEMNSRKPNLIFRGLKTDSVFNSDPLNGVVVFCSEMLGVELNRDFINVFPLGKSGTAGKSLLLVAFLRLQDKLRILTAAKKLKNTGFYIHPDFPTQIRRRRAKLLLIRREVLRVNQRLSASVRGEFLWIDGTKFSWKDGAGLYSNNEKGERSLAELTGVDMSNFLNMLSEDRLPKDYFKPKVHRTTLGSS